MYNGDLTRHVTIEAGHAQLDHIGAIAALTQTASAEWAEADGPDSRVGVGYWYVHEKRDLTAYVSNDQQYVSIEINDHVGDTLASAEIDLNELEVE
jgi:hypothetical protein